MTPRLRMELMTNLIGSIVEEYRRYKALAEAAFAQLEEGELSQASSSGDNTIAVIVWHVAGNLESRFTDFRVSDGEKPWRDRDQEFAPRRVSRVELLDRWERGWRALFGALEHLSDADLAETVTIRRQSHRIDEALHRSLSHTAYHVGQIVYVAKSFRGVAWRSLSIPLGGSAAYNRSPGSEKPSAHAAALTSRDVRRAMITRTQAGVHMKKFYSQWPPVVLMYVATFVLLVVGSQTGAMWPLWVAIIMFTVWDLVWVCSDAPDRTAEETMESATRARTYMSYFVALYGAGLAYFLLRLGEDQQKQVIELFRQARVPLVLILLPFALQTVSMLFFPIRLGGEATGGANGVGLAAKAPTPANLAVLVVNAWVEKVTTFSLLYVIAIVGAFLAR